MNWISKLHVIQKIYIYLYEKRETPRKLVHVLFENENDTKVKKRNVIISDGYPDGMTHTCSITAHDFRIYFRIQLMSHNSFKSRNI